MSYFYFLEFNYLFGLSKPNRIKQFLWMVNGKLFLTIKMKAEKDGDEWVLNGQKVWTSGAHFADYGMIVARSDPSALKHQGLTYFYLDMKTPGIEVRPIKQISGTSNFQFTFGASGNIVQNEFNTDAAWTRTSDRRKKRNINEDSLGLSFINNLKPVTFQWKPSNEFPEEWNEYSDS